jgi:hypothetical protein
MHLIEHLLKLVALCATNKQKRNSMALIRERTILAERPLLVVVIRANFCNRGCHLVSATDHHGCILGFLDMSRYFPIK